MTARAAKQKRVVAPGVERDKTVAADCAPGARPGRARKRRPARRRTPVRLFQIFYDDWHTQMLDSECEPYDNRGVNSELQEFAVFERIAQSRKIAGAKYWGAFSWRFQEKTGSSGKAWLAAMAANPGSDVYYCNPYPANEALFHNLWVQGEPSHPSFILLARAFFEAAGLPAERLITIEPASAFAAANYFVATPAFWAAYIAFIRRAIGNAERKMPARMRSLLHSKLADPRGYHFGATYVPFVVERLFAVFLASEGASFKTHKVALPEREKELNAHLRLLREMKDVAHRTKSNWMAACWVNYRNLYIHHVNGREWCDKYLRSITPTDVKFA